MTRVLIAVGVIAALLVPSTATADVTRTDKQNAKKECKASQKAAGKKNFARLMHTSKRKAYGLARSASRARSRVSVGRRARTPSSSAARSGTTGSTASTAACRSRSSTAPTTTMPTTGASASPIRAQEQGGHGRSRQGRDQRRQALSHRARERLEDNKEWADSIKGHNAFGKCVSWHARHKHSSSS